MDEIADLLGIDETDDLSRLASELVRADLAWIEQLVARRKQLGLSQAQVAEIMERTQSAVSDIETMGTDPRLSTLRRYALAVGAAVMHFVSPDASARPLIKTEQPVTATAWLPDDGHGRYYISAGGGHVTVVSA